MDQNEAAKWHMPWYDWSVFLLPILLFVGLGLESALGPTPSADSQHHDFRAVAHWFDPVFFQYNILMALLAVLVVPSLALSYIQNVETGKSVACIATLLPSARVKSVEEWDAGLRLAPIEGASG